MEVLKCMQESFAGADQDPDKSCRVYFSSSGGSLFFLPLRVLAEKGRGDRNDHIKISAKTTYENYAGLKEAMRADMQDNFFGIISQRPQRDSMKPAMQCLKKLKENQKNLVDSTPGISQR